MCPSCRRTDKGTIPRSGKQARQRILPGEAGEVQAVASELQHHVYAQSTQPAGLSQEDAEVSAEVVVECAKTLQALAQVNSDMKTVVAKAACEVVLELASELPSTAIVIPELVRNCSSESLEIVFQERTVPRPLPQMPVPTDRNQQEPQSRAQNCALGVGRGLPVGVGGRARGRGRREARSEGRRQSIKIV